MNRSPLLLTLLLSGAVAVAPVAFAADQTATAKTTTKPTTAKAISAKPAVKSETPKADPAPAATPNKPAIGAISRSTGHLFREGLASGIAAEGNALKHQALTTNQYGLLTDPASGALPPELWLGTSSSDIEDLLKPLAPATKWPPALTLARRMLLTDVPWPDGDDLDGLRLEKMINFGAANEAARLYAHLAPDKPDARLLHAGVRALVFAGDKSTACLEIQTNPDTWSDVPGELEAKAICAAAAQPGTITTAPKNVADLTTIDTNVDTALNLTGLNDWSGTDDASSLLAQRLIADPRLPAGLRLKLYADHPEAAAPIFGKAVIAPIPKSDEKWDVIAQLLREQQVAPGGATARAHAVLALYDHMPWSVRLLFAPTFESVATPDEFKPDDVKRATGILLAADSDTANRWIARLRANLPVKLTHDPHASALLLLGQMRGLPAAKGPIPLDFSAFSPQKDGNLLAIFKNLSDLLDTEPKFINNPSVIYEKTKDLTQANHYVMPVHVLRSHLQDGAKNGQIGRVILASLLVLQTEDPATINADLLSDMLKSMVATGLNEEARQVATYVFLGAL